MISRSYGVKVVAKSTRKPKDLKLLDEREKKIENYKTSKKRENDIKNDIDFDHSLKILKFERSERTCSKCNNNHRKSDDLRCFLEEAKHPDLNLNNKIQWNDSYIGKMYLACID
jgi:hypothetical protein